MREQDYKFYTDLRNENVSLAKVPKGMKNQWHFKNLVDGKIIDTEKAGRGSKLVIKNRTAYDQFYFQHFPDALTSVVSKKSNIQLLRNSKSRKVKTEPVFFIRGFCQEQINDQGVDLRYFTLTFGFFGVKNPTLVTNKICFVENLDTFLKAENIMGSDFLYLHKYGRVGVDSISGIVANEILVFVDYDFNGLDEYLRIKTVFPQAELYLPENFDFLFETYSRVLDGKQKQTVKVKTSSDDRVIMIREKILKTNRFLEQEILTNE